ncbi:response regulator transcription factor [Vreelandella jeotgali]|uniref:response regulator transcription factor n=1 Tax=Vreelandella jeotgali TaxID=553386 RepID=UPI000346D44F|nr:response regulator transcription factor [Halomonas jeotgali]
MNIVLIEDDAMLARTLDELLRAEGHSIEHLDHGDRAMTLLAPPRAGDAGHDADLVVLDLNLPGAGGLDVLAALRRHDTHTPVLILTARDGVEDRVRGLDLGADDYLAKPFALSELEARVRALLRRRGRSGPVTFGPLEFDSTTLSFRCHGEPLALPGREQRLLACLLHHAGRPVAKARLVQEAFGADNVGDNAVEVYIHRLRKRLPEPLVLRTVRGLGYVLDTRS